MKKTRLSWEKKSQLRKKKKEARMASRMKVRAARTRKVRVRFSWPEFFRTTSIIAPAYLGFGLIGGLIGILLRDQLVEQLGPQDAGPLNQRVGKIMSIFWMLKIVWGPAADKARAYPHYLLAAAAALMLVAGGLLAAVQSFNIVLLAVAMATLAKGGLDVTLDGWMLGKSRNSREFSLFQAVAFAAGSAGALLVSAPVIGLARWLPGIVGWSWIYVVMSGAVALAWLPPTLYFSRQAKDLGVVPTWPEVLTTTAIKMIAGWRKRVAAFLRRAPAEAKRFGLGVARSVRNNPVQATFFGLGLSVAMTASLAYGISDPGAISWMKGVGVKKPERNDIYFILDLARPIGVLMGALLAGVIGKKYVQGVVGLLALCASYLVFGALAPKTAAEFVPDDLLRLQILVAATTFAEGLWLNSLSGLLRESVAGWKARATSFAVLMAAIELSELFGKLLSEPLGSTGRSYPELVLIGGLIQLSALAPILALWWLSARNKKVVQGDD